MSFSRRAAVPVDSTKYHCRAPEREARNHISPQTGIVGAVSGEAYKPSWQPLPMQDDIYARNDIYGREMKKIWLAVVSPQFLLRLFYAACYSADTVREKSILSTCRATANGHAAPAPSGAAEEPGVSPKATPDPTPARAKTQSSVSTSYIAPSDTVGNAAHQCAFA